MSDFVGGLRLMQEENERQKVEALWNGHSRFQAPAYVIGYGGEAEALVLLYLYQRATFINSTTEKETVLEIRVKEEKIADRCGLGPWSVSRAICKLEADCRIRVSRTRDPITGEKQISIYLLLHSTTKLPLTTSPGDYGFCHSNFERPYITLPAESFEVMPSLSRPARAVYLTALAIGSAAVRMKFGVTRADWKKESLLGRNPFNRGVSECLKKRLLTFKHGVLTLTDPETGAPSARTGHVRIDHENPKYKLDFKDVGSDVWRATVVRLSNNPFYEDTATGWTKCVRGSRCPFCGKDRTFSVNFKTGSYRCFDCKHRGGLAILLQKLMSTSNMAKVKAFIREQIPTQEPATATPEPVAAHDGI
jgi:hypothetical protein